MKKFYITTAIPYVNAAPHIGFALELVQTDVLARYYRLKNREVFFLTGTDENALKNVQAAEEAGISTAEFVAANSERFFKLTEVFHISNDFFIRTTSKKHFDGAQKLWKSCRPDDIYKKKYRGKYCVGCEAFYREKDLIDGKCPEHQREPEIIEEENYFFRLSRYQKQLEELIANDVYHIIPESRKNETLSFIRMGLEDFSISRSAQRARGWGVPVPDDSSQIMYVWFDALSNYITALDYASEGENFQKFWPADIHVIGKGILRFHAVYWPAMLLSAQLPLPKKLFVHGYIHSSGKKMSKSLGNIVDPFEFVDRYGVDAVRYYLLRYIHPVQDSDFSQDQFEEAYTSDLSNALGNIVHRIGGLFQKGRLQIIPEKPAQIFDRTLEELIETFSFDQALRYLWEKITELDRYLSEKEPWRLLKEGREKELKKVMKYSVNGLFAIALSLEPFLPQTSQIIKQRLTQKTPQFTEPLFPRLEKKT